MKESTTTSPVSMHCQGNITHARFPSIMNESTSVLLRITRFHHDGKLACGSYPYTTITSSLQKNNITP